MTDKCEQSSRTNMDMSWTRDSSILQWECNFDLVLGSKSQIHDHLGTLTKMESFLEFSLVSLWGLVGLLKR